MMVLSAFQNQEKKKIDLKTTPHLNLGPKSVLLVVWLSTRIALRSR